MKLVSLFLSPICLFFVVQKPVSVGAAQNNEAAKWCNAVPTFKVEFLHAVVSCRVTRFFFIWGERISANGNAGFSDQFAIVTADDSQFRSLCFSPNNNSRTVRLPCNRFFFIQLIGFYGIQGESLSYTECTKFRFQPNVLIRL